MVSTSEIQCGEELLFDYGLKDAVLPEWYHARDAAADMAAEAALPPVT
jgi:hypothetical protein